MTPDEKTLRDAWMREMWAPCHEVSREQRAVDQALAGCLPWSVTTDRIDIGHDDQKDGPGRCANTGPGA